MSFSSDIAERKTPKVKYGRADSIAKKYSHARSPRSFAHSRTNSSMERHDHGQHRINAAKLAPFPCPFFSSLSPSTAHAPTPMLHPPEAPKRRKRRVAHSEPAQTMATDADTLAEYEQLPMFSVPVRFEPAHAWIDASRHYVRPSGAAVEEHKPIDHEATLTWPAHLKTPKIYGPKPEMGNHSSSFAPNAPLPIRTPAKSPSRYRGDSARPVEYNSDPIRLFVIGSPPKEKKLYSPPAYPPFALPPPVHAEKPAKRLTEECQFLAENRPPVWVRGNPTRDPLYRGPELRCPCEHCQSYHVSSGECRCDETRTARAARPQLNGGDDDESSDSESSNSDTSSSAADEEASATENKEQEEAEQKEEPFEPWKGSWITGEARHWA